MDPHSRAPKKNTSNGNEVLPQDTTHLIQGPPDDCKETQTAVVWSCLPLIRSGQNHLARHSERGKKTRQTEEEVGRQHQGMDRPGVRHVPEVCEGNGQKLLELAERRHDEKIILHVRVRAYLSSAEVRYHKSGYRSYTRDSSITKDNEHLMETTDVVFEHFFCML